MNIQSTLAERIGAAKAAIRSIPNREPSREFLDHLEFLASVLPVTLDYGGIEELCALIGQNSQLGCTRYASRAVRRLELAASLYGYIESLGGVVGLDQLRRRIRPSDRIIVEDLLVLMGGFGTIQCEEGAGSRIRLIGPTRL